MVQIRVSFSFLSCVDDVFACKPQTPINFNISQFFVVMQFRMNVNPSGCVFVCVCVYT